MEQKAISHALDMRNTISFFLNIFLPQKGITIPSPFLFAAQIISCPLRKSFEMRLHENGDHRARNDV
jgi:hypothetical protein